MRIKFLPTNDNYRYTKEVHDFTAIEGTTATCRKGKDTHIALVSARELIRLGAKFSYTPSLHDTVMFSKTWNEFEVV